MGKFAAIEIKESVPRLKNLLKRNTREVTRKRLRALLHLKEKTFATRQELADEIGIHIRTLERWLIKYKSQGIISFVSVDKRNKKSAIIDEKTHKLIADKLHNELDPLLGYADAQRWLKYQLGIEIKYHNLRYYFIRHFKSKMKSPRKSHVNKNSDAQASFLKTT